MISFEQTKEQLKDILSTILTPEMFEQYLTNQRTIETQFKKIPNSLTNTMATVKAQISDLCEFNFKSIEGREITRFEGLNSKAALSYLFKDLPDSIQEMLEETLQKALESFVNQKDIVEINKSEILNSLGQIIQYSSMNSSKTMKMRSIQLIQLKQQLKNIVDTFIKNLPKLDILSSSRTSQMRASINQTIKLNEEKLIQNSFGQIMKELNQISAKFYSSVSSKIENNYRKYYTECQKRIDLLRVYLSEITKSEEREEDGNNANKSNDVFELSPEEKTISKNMKNTILMKKIEIEQRECLESLKTLKSLFNQVLKQQLMEQQKEHMQGNKRSSANGFIGLDQFIVVSIEELVIELSQRILVKTLNDSKQLFEKSPPEMFMKYHRFIAEKLAKIIPQQQQNEQTSKLDSQCNNYIHLFYCNSKIQFILCLFLTSAHKNYKELRAFINNYSLNPYQEVIEWFNNNVPFWVSLLQGKFNKIQQAQLNEEENNQNDSQNTVQLNLQFESTKILLGLLEVTYFGLREFMDGYIIMKRDYEKSVSQIEAMWSQLVNDASNFGFTEEQLQIETGDRAQRQESMVNCQKLVNVKISQRKEGNNSIGYLEIFVQGSKEFQFTLQKNIPAFMVNLFSSQRKKYYALIILFSFYLYDQNEILSNKQGDRVNNWVGDENIIDLTPFQGFEAYLQELNRVTPFIQAFSDKSISCEVKSEYPIQLLDKATQEKIIKFPQQVSQKTHFFLPLFDGSKEYLLTQFSSRFQSTQKHFLGQLNFYSPYTEMKRSEQERGNYNGIYYASTYSHILFTKLVQDSMVHLQGSSAIPYYFVFTHFYSEAQKQLSSDPRRSVSGLTQQTLDMFEEYIQKNNLEVVNNQTQKIDCDYDNINDWFIKFSQVIDINKEINNFNSYKYEHMNQIENLKKEKIQIDAKITSLKEQEKKISSDIEVLLIRENIAKEVVQNDKTVKQLRQEIKNLSKDKEQIEDNLKSKQSDKQQLEIDITQLYNKINQLKQEEEKQKDEVKLQEYNLNNVVSEINSLQNQSLLLSSQIEEQERKDKELEDSKERIKHLEQQNKEQSELIAVRNQEQEQLKTQNDSLQKEIQQNISLHESYREKVENENVALLAQVQQQKLEIDNLSNDKKQTEEYFSQKNKQQQQFVNQLQNQIYELKKEKDQVKQSKQNMNTNSSEFDSLNIESQQLSSQTEEEEQQRKDKEFEDFKDQNKHLEKQNKDQLEQVEQSQQQQLLLKTQNNSIEQEDQQNISLHENHEEKVDTEQGALLNQVKQLKLEIINLSNYKNQIEENLRQKLTDQQKFEFEINQLENKIKQLKQEEERYKDAVNQSEQNSDTLSSQFDSLKNQSQQMSSQIEEELLRKDKELESLKEQNKNLEKQKNHQSELLAQSNQTLLLLQSKCDSLEQNISYNKTHLEKVENEQRAYQTEIKDQSMQISQLKSALSQKEIEEKEQQKQMNQLNNKMSFLEKEGKEQKIQINEQQQQIENLDKQQREYKNKREEDFTPFFDQQKNSNSQQQVYLRNSSQSINFETEMSQRDSSSNSKSDGESEEQKDSDIQQKNISIGENENCKFISIKPFFELASKGNTEDKLEQIRYNEAEKIIGFLERIFKNKVIFDCFKEYALMNMDLTLNLNHSTDKRLLETPYFVKIKQNQNCLLSCLKSCFSFFFRRGNRIPAVGFPFTQGYQLQSWNNLKQINPIFFFDFLIRKSNCYGLLNSSIQITQYQDQNDLDIVYVYILQQKNQVEFTFNIMIDTNNEKENSKTRIICKQQTKYNLTKQGFGLDVVGKDNKFEVSFHPQLYQLGLLGVLIQVPKQLISTVQSQKGKDNQNNVIQSIKNELIKFVGSPPKTSQQKKSD